MKKLTLLLVFTLLLANIGSFSVARTQPDLTYEMVFNTVKQAYGVEITNYQTTQVDETTIYCSFDGGYAVVSQKDDETKIEKLWCDTTAYFDNYFGAGTLTPHTYDIYYTNKSQNNKSLAARIPDYILAGVTCVPSAATCLLGFYDRYFDNLILNFTAGMTYGNAYLYYAPTDDVTNAAIQLAYDMGASNPATDGVTVSEFKSGMQTYCARKSLDVSFASCMSWGNFKYDKAVAQLDSGKPVIFFTSGYNIVSIAKFDDHDTVTMRTSNGMHSMTAFGYTQITYTLSNGTTQTDRYLNVASGVDFLSNALVNVDTDINIDDAYAVTIS